MDTIVVGAVESTKVALLQMIARGVPPNLIITAPVARSGMHSDYVDLSQMAAENDIPIIEELDVNSTSCRDLVGAMNPEYIFVIGWSRLCGQEFRNLAQKGVIGYHPSLLPKLRGRAALAWTIILDVRTTGATLFWMDEGMDSGDIAVQHSLGLTGTEYLGDLMAAQMRLLDQMMNELISALVAGKRPALAQDHGKASYIAVRRAADGLINWESPANEIARLVRAVSKPYPGAFSYFGKNTIRIWRAEEGHYPQWNALSGQIFTYESGQPVVRCGERTSLILENYQIENRKGEVLHDEVLTGQKRMRSPAHG